MQAPLTETQVAATNEIRDTSHQCHPNETLKVAPEHSYSLISPRKLKRRLCDQHNRDVAKETEMCEDAEESTAEKSESFQGIVNNLKSKNLISKSCSEVLEATFCGVPLHLMKRIMSKQTWAAFHPALKAIASTLQFYSTKRYNYVRETFGQGLPHICTIRRWYSSVDGNAGFWFHFRRFQIIRAKGG